MIDRLLEELLAEMAFYTGQSYVTVRAELLWALVRLCGVGVEETSGDCSS